MENLKNMWSILEIRVMIVMSLFLQIILIALGSRRKSMKAWWIGSLLWLSYLSADNVATFSLGILLRGCVCDGGGAGSLEDSSIKTLAMLLPVFWSPFLLLHLGGPDTITAYSKKDNELWSRHFLSLVIQTVAVFYGLLKYWNAKNTISILTIPIFVSGLMKYGERTWVMMLTCADPFHLGGTLSESRLGEVTNDAEYLPTAYGYVVLLRSLTSGDTWGGNRDRIPKTSANKAFKLVEIQLSLMFDLFYTKVKCIYSISGVFLRLITSLSTVSVLATFCSIVINDKHTHYSHVDVAITMFLLVGAVALEVYAAFIAIFSDWTLLWLKNRKNPYCESLYQAISSSKLYSVGNKRRWSGSMGQLNLKSYRVDPDMVWKRFFSILVDAAGYLMLSISFDVRAHCLATQADVIDELREEIFKRLKEYKVVDYRAQVQGYKIFSPMQRDNFCKYGLLTEERWNELDFDKMLLVWHMATDAMYDDYDFKEEGQGACKVSKLLADYMFYLYAVCPLSLPKSLGRVFIYANVHDEGYLASPNNLAKDIVEHFQSLMREGTLGKEAMWEMVCDVWVSMLAYAAAKCTWESQIEQLSKGGELLTHVWLLMVYLHLVEEFKFDLSEEVDGPAEH